MTCRTLDGLTLEEAINDNLKRTIIGHVMEGTTQILLAITEYMLHGLTEKEIVSRLRKEAFTKCSKGLTAWVRKACKFINEADEEGYNSDTTLFQDIVVGAVNLSNQNLPIPYK